MGQLNTAILTEYQELDKQWAEFLESRRARTAVGQESLRRWLRQEERKMEKELLQMLNAEKEYIRKELVKWTEYFLGDIQLSESQQGKIVQFREVSRKVLTELDGDKIELITTQIDWTEFEDSLSTILQRRIPGIFEKTGNAEAAGLRASFNLTNPRAVNWLRENAASKVVEITESTRQGLQDILTRYYDQGKTVSQMSREIRKNIGLHSRFANAVENRKQKLIEQGISTRIAEQNARTYAKQLLKLRAETIARTETMDASNQGQLELWRQAGYEKGKKRWLLTPDDRLCDDCAEMEGQEVGVEDDFHSDSLGKYVPCPPLHPDCRCAMRLVARKAEKPEPLSEEEKDALKSYTAGGYHNINPYLRGMEIDPGAIGQAQKEISLLDSAISKNLTQEPMVVKRGTGLSALGVDDAESLRGALLTDKGFLSTSTMDDVPFLYSAKHKADRVILEISVPKGTPHVNIGGAEGEVLLGRGASIEINDVSTASMFGQTVIKLIGVLT